MTKTIIFYLLMLLSISVSAQHRDTLRLTITKNIKSTTTDSVYIFSTQIDTIALQTIKIDTSKMVEDVNPQDLAISKYKVRLLGSVRVNAFYDYNAMTNTEGFKPYEIPVGEEKIPGLTGAYIGARQSRFGIEGTANTNVGSIRTYIEVDFTSTTYSYLRLRHAFAEWNFLKMGYTWTTFMDNAALPTTVDFEGPNSALSKRHGVVRFERKFSENNIFGASIESPKADYYNPNDSLIKNATNQRNLDLAARYKIFNDWGHAQIACIFRKIDFLKDQQMKSDYGWGLLLSTTVQLSEKHKINSQYSIGNGIAYYFVGFTNEQLDAVFNPNTNKMELKQIQGGFISYTYQHNLQFLFSVTGGISGIKSKEFESADAFKSSRYIALNGFYQPIETIRLGLELTSGTRKNIDKQMGNATRISMNAKFDF